MRYVKTDFADGSSFTITSEATGETIWSESSVNASATRAPRQATHSTAGVASLYAASGHGCAGQGRSVQGPHQDRDCGRWQRKDRRVFHAVIG
jgi:hypothetical protein